LLLHLLWVP